MMHTCQYPARDNLSQENVLLDPPAGLLMSLHLMAYNCCKQRKLWWRWEEIQLSPSTKSASELMDNSKIALWEKCYSSGDHLSLHLMILQPLQAIIHFLYLQFINAVAELLQRSELSNRHATLLPLVMGPAFRRAVRKVTESWAGPWHEASLGIRLWRLWAMYLGHSGT